MLGLLDRTMIYAYIKAYLVCVVSLMGLFIVVDLFTNLDDFTQQRHGFAQTFRIIGLYYANLSPRIFDRLCEAIALLAAMFTVAMMQRNNELLPLLSAGVSTRRVVTPVLLAACLMVGLTLANQELVLPNIDAFLIDNRSDPHGEKKVEFRGISDRNRVHISGQAAYRNTETVEKFFCVVPPAPGRDSLTTLQAENARYVPPQNDDPYSGGWMLTRTTPAELENWNRKDILELIEPGRYFLRTEIDFQTAIRSRTWYIYLTTWQLLEEMEQPGNLQQAGLAVVFHQRLTRPVLGILLVVIGLGVILRDQNRNIFVSAGMCLVLCAVFFASILTCQYLGTNEHISPALSAWIPVLAFGPLAFVMFDAVHT